MRLKLSKGKPLILTIEWRKDIVEVKAGDFKIERQTVQQSLDKVLAEFPEYLKTSNGNLRLGRDLEFNIGGFKATLENPTYEALIELRTNTNKAFSGKGTFKTSPNLSPNMKIDVDAVNQAKANIIEKSLGRTNLGIDPTIIKDYAVVGYDYLQKGLDNYAKWKDQMIKEFGEEVKPHLLRIWAQAKEVSKQVKPEEQEPVKTGSSLRTNAQSVADINAKAIDSWIEFVRKSAAETAEPKAAKA